MKYSIQIPKPCTASWDEMTSTENGRHCSLCSKTVVDFTNWQENDILNYLQEQSSNRVCGRFRQEQVNIPVSDEQFVQTVVRVRMPLYKKIAAIFLFAFGLLQVSPDTASAQKTGTVHIATDTPLHHNNILGGVRPMRPDTTHKPPKTGNNKHLMGKPAIKKTVQKNENVTLGEVYYAPAKTPENILTGAPVMQAKK